MARRLRINVSCFRNGAKAKVRSGSYKLDATKMASSWKIELADPVPLSLNDLWSLSVNVEGNERVLFSNVKADEIGYEDQYGSIGRNASCSESASVTVTTTGGESAQVSDLTSYCIPKTFCFVNPDWLNIVEPTARLKGSIIVYGGLYDYYSGADTGYSRYYHSALPGKDISPDNLSTFLSCKTHHDVGRFLAGLIGYRLVVNTPDMEIVDTMTIPSGTKWGDAITGIFSLWGPEVRVVPGSSDGKTPPTIYIGDVLTNDGDPSVTQTISVPTAVLVGISRKASSKVESASNSGGNAKNQIVDHVIIRGRKSRHTVLDMRFPDDEQNQEAVDEDQPDFTVTKIPGQWVAPNMHYVAQLNMNEILEQKRRGAYQGPFGVPPYDYDPLAVQQQIRVIHVFKPVPPESPPGELTSKKEIAEWRRKWKEQNKPLPCGETTVTYDGDGVVSMTKTYNKFSSDNRIIASYEELFMRTRRPGTDTAELIWCHAKSTSQDTMINPLNLAITKEFVEEMVVYDEVQYEGQTYKDNPRSLVDVLRSDMSRTAIDKAPETPQRLMEMTTHVKNTIINRVSPIVLIKQDIDVSLLSGAVKTTSQMLENPERDKSTSGDSKKQIKTGKKEDQFQLEFFSGSGRMIGSYGPCYHPPTTIEHRDIDTIDIAAAVAERVFVRKAVPEEEITAVDNPGEIVVKTPFPVPFPSESVCYKVTVPVLSYEVNGVERTVPGGTYKLKEIEESFSSSGSDFTYEQRLTLKRGF